MKNLIFLGDSITDSNHLWLSNAQEPDIEFTPIYETSAERTDKGGLGDGYVSLLAGPLTTRYPGIQIRNKGQDGFTAGAVLRSLEWNCLAYKPDAVSLLIGINDVAVAQNTGRSLADIGFRQQIHAILQKLLASDVRQIFCMGPFVFPWPAEYRNWFPLILEAERLFCEEAAAFGLPFLPLQAAMNNAASNAGIAVSRAGITLSNAGTAISRAGITPSNAGISSFTTDGIHLTRTGHRFLAEQWLNAFIAG